MYKIFFSKKPIYWAFFVFNFLATASFAQDYAKNIKNTKLTVRIGKDTNRVHALIPTFLGNETRNYYGNRAPSKLNIIWKINLGKGETIVGSETKMWVGAGWTGQPLYIRNDDVDYIIQGAYDYHLRKINAATGQVIWKYKFDDVIKGTATFFENKKAENIENRYIIMQGSRRGFGVSINARLNPSYRAISFMTGKELWRLNSKRTFSYSRDVDASALIIRGIAYIGLENAIFTVFDPDPSVATIREGILQPKILDEDSLWQETDRKLHGGNLVTEASPALLGDRVYVASGSGHVYGYNLHTHSIDWDFFIGSDMDGTTIVTDDSCLLVSVEKQYIEGQGGVFKLDPRKKPKDAVIWYFPTKDKKFVSWLGGIIGSVAINDYYKNTKEEIVFSDSSKKKYQDIPNIAAFIGIDGYLYVVNHKKLVADKTVSGPRNENEYATPELVFKYKIGPSIGSPIIVDNKLIATGYEGIYLFEFDENMKFRLVQKTNFGISESTPIVMDGRMYIASRDGYLYCLGEK